LVKHARPLPALHSPVGVAIDAHNNVYVADAGAHAVFVLPANSGGEEHTETTGPLNLLAGQGVPGLVDGVGSNARFVEPYALAISPDGLALAVADRRACVVRHIRLPRRQPPVAPPPLIVRSPRQPLQTHSVSSGRHSSHNASARPLAGTSPDAQIIALPVHSRNLGQGAARQIGRIESSSRVLPGPSQQDLWIKKGLARVFPADVRLGNLTAIDALKSEIQDAKSPQQRLQRAEIETLLTAQRERDEEEELARLTHGVTREGAADVLQAFVGNPRGDVAGVDALKQEVAARLGVPAAMALQATQGAQRQAPSLPERGLAGSGATGVARAPASRTLSPQAALPAAARARWETWRDDGFLDGSNQTADNAAEGTAPVARDLPSRGSASGRQPAHEGLQVVLGQGADLGRNTSGATVGAGRGEARGGESGQQGAGRERAHQRLDGDALPPRVTAASTVLTDGEEVPEVRVDTDEEDPFENGTWELAMTLFLLGGLLMAVRLCWRHNCLRSGGQQRLR